MTNVGSPVAASRTCFHAKKEANPQMQFEPPELKVIRFEAKDILTASLISTDGDAESDPIISGE